MKKRILLSLFCCALLPAFAQQASLKIGFVNSQKVLGESKQARAVQGQLEKEFAPQIKEMEALANELKAKNDKLERDGSVMSATEKQSVLRDLEDGKRNLERKQARFTEDSQRRQGEELRKLVQRIQKVIAEFAAKEKFTLIVQDAVYIDPKIDLTDRVITLINQ